MINERGPDITAWLARLDNKQRDQAEELTRIVDAVDTRVQQAVKWNRITFTI